MTAGPKPSIAPVVGNSIPESLRELNRWGLWQYQLNDKETIWTKAPVDANGFPVNLCNPENHRPFDAVIALHRPGVDGLGVGFALGENVAGVDLDDCRDVTTGELTPEAADIVRRLNSYTEVSPSGAGVKIFVTGTLPANHSTSNETDNQAKTVEIYTRGRYFALTGQHLAGTPLTVEDRQQELTAVWTEYIYKVQTAARNNGKDKTQTKNPQRPKEIPMKTIYSVGKTKVSWLWQHRIPLGKLTMVTGYGDAGKSTFCCWVAACVTQGVDMPESPFGSGKANKGSVIIFSCEDGEADTIRPRLELAGADLKKVMTPEDAGFHLSIKHDLDALERAIVKQGDCRLVIIEPVTAFMEGINPRSNSEVRAAFMALKVLAEKHKLAFLLLSHFSKSDNENTNHRVIDSVAFTDACRSNIVICKYQEHDKRALFCEKHNLGPQTRALAFRLAVIEDHPTIEWLLDEEITVTSAQALANVPKPPGKAPDARNSAKAFLSFLLAKGPLSSKEIRARCEAHQPEPISQSTLYRAKEELGVEAFEQDGVTMWKLPTVTPA